MPNVVPKISAIIHFLNSEKYLKRAIESVFRQTFVEWELILVDGGSIDTSIEIAKYYQEKFPQKVRFFQHQGNKPLGIFSSRIWGAKEAKAPILALLDSDDEWHPQFLERHYNIYQSVFGSSLGMVYCPMVYWWDDPVLASRSFVQPIPNPGLHHPPDLLLDFIKDNYQRSAGNSSVMIAREIVIQAFNLIGIADEKAVEDQFLWSFVILKYPIFISSEPLVRYRQWLGSTCAIAGRMQTIQMRIRHLKWLEEHLTNNYQGALKESLIKQLRKSIFEAMLKSGEIVKTKNLFAYWNELGEGAKNKLKKIIGVLYKLIKPFTRLRLTIGVRPLSYLWGSDRGLPIHRYYVEKFLEEFSNDIRGNCLEFQDAFYATKFGKVNVKNIDILHIDDSNPKATIVADLTKPNSIASDKFDCIICTHVLHIIAELDKFISESYRILKPGGVLLITVPHVSMCDSNVHELWRFTPEGLELVLVKSFGKDYVTSRTYGNSLTAAGEIRGLVSYEFTPSELDAFDQRFSVEVCARAVKKMY